MTWKSRSETQKLGVMDFYDSRFGNTTHAYEHPTTTSTQVTYSEGHEWPAATLTHGNVGGPFYTDKLWVDTKVDHLAMDGNIPGRTWWHYTGPSFLGTLGLGNLYLNGPVYGASSIEVLQALAGPVVKNLSPTESEAGLSQALGELKREGLPRLIGGDVLESRARDFRSYGSEYLNVQFGWLPFVSDVHDLCHAVKDSHRILTQFKRDSGRVIRRRADLPVDETNGGLVDEGGFYAAPLNGDCWNVIYRPTKSRTSVHRKRWVVAAYQYYLDPGDSLIGKFTRFNQEADKLLGLSLSPEVLWELAPWSWAVDWFSNTGNSISALSDFINFGPALKYAYVMETTVSKKEYFAQGFEDALGNKHDFSTTSNRVVKTRDPVSPFTFRHVDGALTGQQLAIAAALGVTNVPGAVRP